MLANFGINWATPFLLLAIFGIISYFTKPKDGEKGQINWNPLEAVAVTVAIYYIGQIVGYALFLCLYSLYTSIIGAHDITYFWHAFKLLADLTSSPLFELKPLQQFLQILCIEGVTFSLLILFLRRRGAKLRTIGLGRKPGLRDLGYVVIGFLIYFVIYLMALTVFKQAFPHVNDNQQQIIGFNGASGLQLPFVFVSLAILPPVVEELMVRGFLYSGLKKGLPIIWAAIITSVLFATAHLQAGNGEPLLWTAALDTFVLSFVLIYLREKTGSLWASIGLHMLKNSIAFFSLFVFHIL